MSNMKIVVDCSTGVTSYLPLSAAEIAINDQQSAAAIEADANRVIEVNNTSEETPTTL